MFKHKLNSLVFILGSFILLIITGCNNTTELSNEVKPKTDTAHAFRVFLKKFRALELPYNSNENSQSKIDLKYNQIDATDSLFISEQSFICEGYLPDTSNYFCLILLVPADDVYPMLYTFNKTGKPIDSKSLALIGTGGFMCGSQSNAKWQIDEKLNIFCSDTVTANECDSVSGFPIKGKIISYNKNISGKILKDGKIDLEEF